MVHKHKVLLRFRHLWSFFCIISLPYETLFSLCKPNFELSQLLQPEREHPLDDAVRLVFMEGRSYNEAAAEYKLTKRKVQRAVEAVRSGRQPGRNGRPKLIGAQHKRAFKELVTSMQNAGNAMRVHDAKHHFSRLVHGNPELNLHRETLILAPAAQLCRR